MEIKTMKSRLSHLLTILILAAGAAFINACGSSNSMAGSTLTTADVQSMIDASIQAAIKPLNDQIAALQANQDHPAIYIKAPQSSAYAVRSIRRARSTQSIGFKTAAVSTTCSGIGTLTGRPTSSDPMESDLASGLSCTNYIFNVRLNADPNGYGYIQAPLASGTQMQYDGPNCTGTPYLYGLSALAGTANGFVFTFGGGTNATDPADYYYVAQGSTVMPFTMLSFSDGFTCTDEAASGFGPQVGAGLPVLPNDYSVTQIQSAPIAGQVLISP